MYTDRSLRREVSGFIYEVEEKGKKYYMHTASLSLSGPGGEGHAPGPFDPDARKSVPRGLKIVGHIHNHPAGSGDINKTWSGTTASRQAGSDLDNMKLDDQLIYYLVNNIGSLLVRRPDNDRSPNQDDEIIVRGLYDSNPVADPAYFRGNPVSIEDQRSRKFKNRNPYNSPGYGNPGQSGITPDIGTDQSLLKNDKHQTIGTRVPDISETIKKAIYDQK